MTLSAFSGLSDEAFTDSAWFSRSEEEQKESGPHMSRMTSPSPSQNEGAGLPHKSSCKDSLEVDLEQEEVVRYIQTNGCNGIDDFVKSYRLQYAQSDRQYHDFLESDGTPKIFEGNTSNNTLVQHSLGQLKARYVRIVPVDFTGSNTLRWKLYIECKQLNTFCKKLSNSKVTMRFFFILM